MDELTLSVQCPRCHGEDIRFDAFRLQVQCWDCGLLTTEDGSLFCPGTDAFHAEEQRLKH